MTTGTQWQIGADTRVIVHPQDECDAARLFMADASYSVTLMPPTDPETYPQFTKFLEDLAEAASELAAVYQTPEQT
ncbi:hypothetical protein KIPE111705_45110 [Kibdelosporangium persicum]|uniref:Uncharacterized protein n=1 Tax=Kibdelosporangium persicum TaxID=2698649 RepID=A0ABX2F7H8_9PSEU|nr:hypothetical protein [Kibdelosporangium persicum]NRN67311.1 hypothetical protein [Kibdelosporangium persicum]